MDALFIIFKITKLLFVYRASTTEVIKWCNHSFPLHSQTQKHIKMLIYLIHLKSEYLHICVGHLDQHIVLFKLNRVQH